VEVFPSDANMLHANHTDYFIAFGDSIFALCVLNLSQKSLSSRMH